MRETKETTLLAKILEVLERLEGLFKNAKTQKKEK